MSPNLGPQIYFFLPLYIHVGVHVHVTCAYTTSSTCIDIYFCNKSYREVWLTNLNQGRGWCTPATSRCVLLQTNYKTASKLRHSRNREDILRSSVLIADFFAHSAQKHTQRVFRPRKQKLSSCFKATRPT